MTQYFSLTQVKKMSVVKEISYHNIDYGIRTLGQYQFNFYLTNQSKKQEKTLFHVYWNGDLRRHQLLCINSYLATQDLTNTQLWVWLDYQTASQNNREKIPIHPNILVKIYNPKKESLETPFAEKKFPK